MMRDADSASRRPFLLFETLAGGFCAEKRIHD
jgi:hypothetical protein